MKRIVELDGIRGIAIGLVLVWHLLTNQLAVPGVLVQPLVSATRLTWSGVDLFFVLSGFLIVGILLDKKESGNYFGVFYIRRACRILPLYFVVFASFLLLLYLKPPQLAWLLHNPLPLWSYAVFVQNFLMEQGGGADWMSVTWSLAIEEQFYLLIPVLVRFLSRRQLAAVFVGLIVLALLYRASSDGLEAFFFPFARADSILFGGLLAVLVRHEKTFAVLRDARIGVAALFFVFLAGAGYLTLFDHIIGGTWNHAWVAAMYGTLLLMPLLWSDAFINRWLKARVLVWLGLRSYGIYLLHLPVTGALHGYLLGRRPFIDTPDAFLITIASVALTFIAAEMSYRVIESPFLRYGHGFRYLPTFVGDRSRVPAAHRARL